MAGTLLVDDELAEAFAEFFRAQAHTVRHAHSRAAELRLRFEKRTNLIIPFDGDS